MTELRTGYCPDCHVDPDEDPLPWCDCRRDDYTTTWPPTHSGACRFRSHDPVECLKRPAAELLRLADEAERYARGVAGFDGGGRVEAEATAYGAMSVARAARQRAAKLDGEQS